MEFFPFHNKHIRFLLRNHKTFSGVIVDDLTESKPSDMHYRFIPSENLVTFLKAEGDKGRMDDLSKIINISEIVTAEIIE